MPRVPVNQLNRYPTMVHRRRKNARGRLKTILLALIPGSTVDVHQIDVVWAKETCRRIRALTGRLFLFTRIKDGRMLVERVE